MVHLFNDVLVYGIPLSGERMQFRKYVNLLRCAVENVDDTEASVNCFDVVHNTLDKDKSRTRFCAHSREVKAIWMDLISQQIQLLHEQRETHG